MSKGFHRLPPDMAWSNQMQALGYAKVAEVELDITVKDGETITIETADYMTGGKLGPSISHTFEVGPAKLEKSSARAQGFTGDQCSNCGSMRMVHSGTCNTCQDCGTTTGCS